MNKDKLHWKILEDITKYFAAWGSQHYRILGFGVHEIINKDFREAEK